MNLNSHISYLEATARRRIAGLLDPDSFHEFIPPTLKRVSPHLGLFDAPVAFDDGAIIGEAKMFTFLPRKENSAAVLSARCTRPRSPGCSGALRNVSPPR